jgi:tetratricopeptide (TPR) repeat protein
MSTFRSAVIVGLVALALVQSGRAQVDDICREFGVIPSLDMPWAQVPYLYGRVTLNRFDESLKPKVSVIFSDRDNPSKKITLSKSGNYCFKRSSGSGGSLVIEIDGIEVARRTLASFGAAQQREDFDIYPNSAQSASAPGAISAKFSHPRNEKTVELYQKAAAAEKSRDLDVAVGSMKRIVEIDPADFIAWSVLGSLHLEQKAYAESDAAIRKSLGLKIEYTPAWITAGRLRVAQNQTEAGIEIFKHAASLEPKSARIYRYLGEAYLQTKQGTLAVEALKESIRLDPVGMADCHLLIGRLYDAAGAKGLAAREFKAFLAKVPDYADKKKLEKYVQENPE